MEKEVARKFEEQSASKVVDERERVEQALAAAREDFDGRIRQVESTVEAGFRREYDGALDVIQKDATMHRGRAADLAEHIQALDAQLKDVRVGGGWRVWRTDRCR